MAATYYKVTYGNWRNNNSVKLVIETYSRKEAFKIARETADLTGEEVTISATNGMRGRIYKVTPETSAQKGE